MKMWTKVTFLSISILGFFTLLSCDEIPSQSSEKNGSVKFAFNGSSAQLSKTGADSVAKKLYITLRDLTGKEVLKLQSVDLVSFGNGYVSLPVSLPEGSYELTEFLAVTADNKTIFAAPLTGSPKAYLVEKPLPLGISVVADQVASLDVEVLRVQNGEPSSEFGYVSFTFNEKKTLDLKLAVLALNNESGKFELVSGNLTLKVNSKTYLSTQFEAKTNTLTINQFQDDDVISFELTSENHGSKTIEFLYFELKLMAGNPIVITLTPNQSIDTKLLAFYPLDGNANDISGNQLNGTVIGAQKTSDRFNQADHAYYFDGNNSIDLGNILNDTHFPFSVSVWVRPETEQMIGRIFHTDFGLNQDAYYGFGVFYRDGNFDISTGTGTGSGYQNRFGIKTISTYPVQNWYHITAVFAAEFTYKIYVNGVLAQSFGDGSGINVAHNFDSAVIGAKFIGAIDDVRIFDNVLSEKEISSLYSDGQ
ncbi:MAG: LamG domain-containing protein [Bacteroidetes bacterium]|nr:LamG domain-containing protein [Bacteroidota bacterium]